MKHAYLNHLLVLAVLLLLAPAGMFAQDFYSGGGEGYYGEGNPSDTHALKVGKEGHITLVQATRVGDEALAPGDYEVRHRRSANGHFVEFTRVVANYTGPQQSLSPSDWVVTADVPCTLQSLNAPVTRTSAEISRGAIAHLNSLRIRGENAMHVFQAGPDASAPQNQIEYGGGGM